MSCNLGMHQEPGSAGLPALQLLFAAEPGRRLDALLCYITVDNRWQFYFTPCFQDHCRKCVGGRSPLRPAFRGAAAPHASPLPTSVLVGPNQLVSVQNAKIRYSLRCCSFARVRAIFDLKSHWSISFTKQCSIAGGFVMSFRPFVSCSVRLLILCLMHYNYALLCLFLSSIIMPPLM